jgi:hypothetical protein
VAQWLQAEHIYCRPFERWLKAGIATAVVACFGREPLRPRSSVSSTVHSSHIAIALPREGQVGGRGCSAALPGQSLQLIAVLAEEASGASRIVNGGRITGLLPELIEAIAPTLLQNPRPQKRQALIVGILRDRGRYDLADQLQSSSALTDEPIPKPERNLTCSPTGGGRLGTLI